MRNELAITVNGEKLLLDVSGAAFWPAGETLIFADLHLEKSSSYARGRQFLPPYDTQATLLKMAGAAQRFRPRRIIALGDSFHDPDAADRLSGDAHAMLKALSGEFIWITGNHDPRPPAWLGGMVAEEWAADGLVFRHEPQTNPRPGEIAGHLHPCARYPVPGRRNTSQRAVTPFQGDRPNVRGSHKSR